MSIVRQYVNIVINLLKINMVMQYGKIIGFNMIPQVMNTTNWSNIEIVFDKEIDAEKELKSIMETLNIYHYKQTQK